MASAELSAASPFKLRTLGPLDAVRRYLLSENFQGAVQLALGILFVSLFVFVQGLRFPGSCVGVLLYIVVAVTAAPDNHVGTRIYLCGFMSGPMWLALLTGGMMGTLARLAPTPQGHLIALSILGPLAIIPFAITRVGTSHTLMWAMGMVSTLYLGLPILAGFTIPSLTMFWQRSVGFIFVAAVIAMFGGSVLSMVILPSLASHKIEDEVAFALTQLGHHLSHTVSHIMRQPQQQQQQQHGQGMPLPEHLQTVHPLILQQQQQQQLEARSIAPGVLDKDVLVNGQVSPAEVYAAVMDWFEHLSRPPQQHKTDDGCIGSSKGLATLRRGVSSSSVSSTRVKSTFYGPKGTGLAVAVVAAAAADSLDDWADVDTADSPSTAAASNDQLGSSCDATINTSAAISSTHMQPRQASSQCVAAPGPRSIAQISNNPNSTSLPRCKQTQAPTNLDQHPMCKHTVNQPVPSIAEIRQALAHAVQLLEPAKAEPQWLRSPGRRFDAAAWTKVITQAQALAMRLSALDLLHRDHMSLLDTSHCFPISEPLESTLRVVYGTAAAAVSLLAAEVADRGDGYGPAAYKSAAALLESPEWCVARDQLWGLAQQELVSYWQRVKDASPDQPVTLPRATWVRQWMFFILATRGIMDALESLIQAAVAATSDPPKHSIQIGFIRCSKQSLVRKQRTALYQQQCSAEQQQKREQHPQGIEVVTSGKDIDVLITSPATVDVEAAAAAASAGGDSIAAAPHQAPVSNLQQQQRQQQGCFGGLKHWVLMHTGWMTPWLPLALNLKQFEQLCNTFTRDVPRMFSSKAALKAQLQGRRFQAGLKYWFVCSSVMVSVLVLLHYVPAAYRYAPNFGYSAAAVGMSDRVESTVYKVCIWIASSIAGAILGWALMSTAAMANNAVALAAIICCVAFIIGSLGRSRDILVTLLTLMTLASVVLCQYVGCCGYTGSTTMAIMRGVSVTAAALFSVLIQNLIWPWYTSSWALEQLGQTYQSAANMLADLVCQLYKDTDDLINNHVQGSDLGSDLIRQPVQGSALAGDLGQVRSTAAGRDAAARMQQLNEAVDQVLQQQQQQDLRTATTPSAGTGWADTVLRFRHVSLEPTSTSGLGVLQDLLQQQRRPMLTTQVAGTVAAVAAEYGAVMSPSSPNQLQSRLLKPLVQVKVSLVLDTTAWMSGPFATPRVVTHMLHCMFDVADALGALQQALALPVDRLSGSWYWTLRHMAQPWGQVLAEVLLMADATVKHLQQPCEESASQLLIQIQKVQQERFEFFRTQRDLRRLVHIAVATDDQLLTDHIGDQNDGQLEGHLQYAGTLYATAKVLDKMTAVARCALEVDSG